MQTDFPFLEGKKILVACSGGVDSVVLAYLLEELKYSISIAHCNFSLRGKESDGDEEFVKKLSKQLKVPFFSETFETKKYASENKISAQMAARNIRYKWFNDLCITNGFDFIATGHHLDDDVETFLINLTRGTGLRGLTGIPEKNKNIIRPLLNFSREEILKYASQKNISWREDSSNKTTDYLRNALRLKVVPQLKELEPSFLQNFKQTQRNLQESKCLVNDYLEVIKKSVFTKSNEGVHINIEKLRDFPNTKAVLYELLAPYGFTSWKSILELLEAQTGKQIFSKTHRLLKNRGFLVVSEMVIENTFIYEISKTTKNIKTPIKMLFEEVDCISESDAKTVFVDSEKLTFPLQLRNWKLGDVFHPFGMQGKKKLSKFFKDEKLSLVAKEKIWLLLSNNEIVWIVGKRLDNRFRVTGKTKKILKIVIEK